MDEDKRAFPGEQTFRRVELDRCGALGHADLMNLAARGLRTVSIILSIFLVGLVVADAGIPDDPEIKSLNAEIEAAGTQTEMNLLSKKMCDVLDARLKAVEQGIRKGLDADGLRLFDSAIAAWKDYRNAQVIFEGSFSEGGSIQPLVHNQTYSRITEVQIDALLKFREEVVEGR